MKKLLTATLLTLSATTQAADFTEVRAASIGYASSYSNPSVAANVDKGEVLGFDSYAENTRLFCGVTSISTGSILATGYSATLFKAPRDDFYLVVCIKSSGASDDAVVVIAEPVFFGYVQRSDETVDPGDMQKLESVFAELLN